jgi:DNA-binding HxlR family transcriptional regulator
MTDWAAAQLAVNLISGKWDIRLLAALDPCSKRYNELSRDMGIRHKVLTETLQRHERDGLISRTVGEGSPPEVWYELTPLARSLMDPLAALAEWARHAHSAAADTGGPLGQVRGPRRAAELGVLSEFAGRQALRA